jgi:transposase
MSVAPEQPEPIDAAEVEQLIALAEQGQLDAGAQRRIAPLLGTLVWLQHCLLETRISLSKLRRILFGKRTEKSPRRPKDPPASDTGSGGDDTAPPPGDGETESGDGDPENGPSDGSTPRGELGARNLKADAKTDKPPPPGHGRLGADDYPGAEVQLCAHGQLAPGSLCPTCQDGRLYAMPPLVRLRFTGQPLASVTRYELERLRCASCGEIVVAHLPPEAPRERYDVGLRVMLAVSHYFLGLPFKRIEVLQQALGKPLPDATQWELVEALANGVYPVFEYLKFLGAQQPLVYQDDTGARVLSLIKDNQADPPPERKAMYTTVLRFEGERSICLYFTGRQHAGENLDDILALRDEALPPMLWMSDALAANTPKRHPERVVDMKCLTHGRRQFIEIAEYFPSESARVIEAIATIYHHDAQCKENKLTAEQRLAYHQTHSAPVMGALKSWMEQQLDDHQVEPNSRLGGAFAYLLKHWVGLTRFLHVPGAPLDNNLAEQALKLIVRYRNNSLFYRNEHGAYVGDVLISLIETCRLNGVNPVDYLSTLLHHRSAVFADPAAWLPWNYQQTLAAQAQPPPLSDPSPVFGHGGGLGVAVP